MGMCELSAWDLGHNNGQCTPLLCQGSRQRSAPCFDANGKCAAPMTWQWRCGALGSGGAALLAVAVRRSWQWRCGALGSGGAALLAVAVWRSWQWRRGALVAVFLVAISLSATASVGTGHGSRCRQAGNENLATLSPMALAPWRKTKRVKTITLDSLALTTSQESTNGFVWLLGVLLFFFQQQRLRRYLKVRRPKMKGRCRCEAAISFWSAEDDDQRPTPPAIDYCHLAHGVASVAQRTRRERMAL
jgi:hypothetical protein